MTDEEFFAHLLNLWEYTTGAENTYWDFRSDGDEGWDVHSTGQDGSTTFVGYFDQEVDADFVTAIHGCLPDLVRRLEDAIDKANMYELAHDACQRELYESELENCRLREQLK